MADTNTKTPTNKKVEVKKTPQKTPTNKKVEVKTSFSLVRVNGEYYTAFDGKITVPASLEEEAKKVCG